MYVHHTILIQHGKMMELARPECTCRPRIDTKECVRQSGLFTVPLVMDSVTGS